MSALFFISCQNSTLDGHSKECTIIKEFQDCLFDTEDPGCFGEKMPLIGLIGTQYEDTLDKYMNKQITSKELVDSIAKKSWQEVSVSFNQKHKHLINKNDLNDTLIEFRRHYNCSFKI